MPRAAAGPCKSKTRPLLAKKLPEEWQFLLFDYAAYSTGWPAWPQIAGCLADYMKQLSDEHKQLGGDGLVYLVTHSMGGLAARFAVDSGYGILAGLADRSWSCSA